MKIQRNQILAAMTLLLIFWSGRLSVQFQIAQGTPPIEQVPDVNPKIPLVEIMSIEQGKMKGKVNDPTVRLRAGDVAAVPDRDLQFELVLSDIGVKATPSPKRDSAIPAWAQFVASKRGKYYYTLEDNAGKKLSVQNKVYFKNEEEAIAAGYQRRTR